MTQSSSLRNFLPGERESKRSLEAAESGQRQALTLVAAIAFSSVADVAASSAAGVSQLNNSAATKLPTLEKSARDTHQSLTCSPSRAQFHRWVRPGADAKLSILTMLEP